LLLIYRRVKVKNIEDILCLIFFGRGFMDPGYYTGQHLSLAEGDDYPETYLNIFV
jgi:hypothetical protein